MPPAVFGKKQPPPARQAERKKTESRALSRFSAVLAPTAKTQRKDRFCTSLLYVFLFGSEVKRPCLSLCTPGLVRGLPPILHCKGPCPSIRRIGVRPQKCDLDFTQAIVRALNKFNVEDSCTSPALLKATIGEAIGLNGDSDEVDMLQRKIHSLNRKMLDLVKENVQDGADIENHKDEFKELSEPIEQLKIRIKTIPECESADGDANDRLEQIQQTIQDREKRKFQYDDAIVRQMIACSKGFSDGKLEILFGGGYVVEECLTPSSNC